MNLIYAKTFLFIYLFKYVLNAKEQRQKRKILLKEAIHLDRENFVNSIEEVCRRIRELQIAYLQDSIHESYIIPVYFFQYPTPIYLGLNVLSPNLSRPIYEQSFPSYLYLNEIFEIYSENSHHDPLYAPGHVPYQNLNFDFSIYSLTRDSVLNECRRKSLTTIVRLALVFVESIRFINVRDYVGGLLQGNNGGMANFWYYHSTIRNWEADSRIFLEQQNGECSLESIDHENISVMPVSIIIQLAIILRRIPIVNRNYNKHSRQKRIVDQMDENCSFLPQVVPKVSLGIRLFNPIRKLDNIYSDYECWLECFYTSEDCKASNLDRSKNVCLLFGDKFTQARENSFQVFMAQSIDLSHIPFHNSNSCCSFWNSHWVFHPFTHCCCIDKYGELFKIGDKSLNECSSSSFDNRGCTSGRGWLCARK